jgi:ribosomal protein S24E
MHPNKLTFESENLQVDYISFKFQKLENSTQKKIADYLFKLGFNSYKESGKLTKPIKESILVSSKNKFEVCFVEDNPYWDGTLLHFSGLNASRFYFFSKEQIIDWIIFSSAVLSRFDLYFERNYKTADKISGREFLQNCQKNLKQTNKNISLEKNRKGWILKIGNRKSNHYFRIYETKNSLRFEHEMKGKVLQQYHLLLV